MTNSTRATVPESDPVSPVPDSVTGSSRDETAMDLSHLPAEHREPVRRLYERVEEAVSTIQELRSENEALRARVAELEAQPTFPDDESVLSLDEDPDVLKGRINNFIEAIDTYLNASDRAHAVDEDDAERQSDSPAS